MLDPTDPHMAACPGNPGRSPEGLHKVTNKKRPQRASTGTGQLSPFRINGPELRPEAPGALNGSLRSSTLRASFPAAGPADAWLRPLGREKEPAEPGEGAMCSHTNTKCRHLYSGNHVLYLESLSEGISPLAHRKAANHVVWYKAMAKGPQEVPHRWGPRLPGLRLPRPS